MSISKCESEVSGSSSTATLQHSTATDEPPEPKGPRGDPFQPSDKGYFDELKADVRKEILNWYIIAEQEDHSTPFRLQLSQRYVRAQTTTGEGGEGGEVLRTDLQGQPSLCTETLGLAGVSRAIRKEILPLLLQDLEYTQQLSLSTKSPNLTSIERALARL